MLAAYCCETSYCLEAIENIKADLKDDIEGRGPKVTMPPPRPDHPIRVQLERIEAFARKLKLTSVLHQLARLSSHLAFPSTAEQISLEMEKLYERVQDSLENQQFFYVPSELVELYDQPRPLWGQSVEDAFPSGDNGEDIDEAGKCLALGRYTACVFHLMRLMERIGQQFAAKLGIENVARELGKLLSDTKPLIDAMPKGDVREHWNEVHALLYNVKEAYRNKAMHPRQTYTKEQATEAFLATRAFVSSIAKLFNTQDA